MALTTKPDRGETDSRPSQAGLTARPTSLDDHNAAAIIDDARTGSELAWRTIVSHYAPALEAFAASKHVEDPAGTASTTLLDFARSVGNFRGSDKRSLDAYIYRIARNRMTDEFRKQSIQTVELPDDPKLIDQSALDIENSIATRDWVADALETLSNEQRQVIELRILEDRSVAETAVLLNKNPGAVHVLQHRAIKALRIAMAAVALLVLFFGIRWLTQSPVRIVDSTPANQVDVPIQDLREEADETESAPQVLESSEDDGGEVTVSAPSTRESNDTTTTIEQTGSDNGSEISTIDGTATNSPTPVDPSQSATSTGPTTSIAPPQDIAPSTTVAPTQEPALVEPTPAPTTAAPLPVAIPWGCEVQLSGVRTQGVEVHEPTAVFADSYALLDQFDNVVIVVSDPQQVEGPEIEFESIPGGFDITEIYSVSAVEDGVLSRPRVCSRVG